MNPKVFISHASEDKDRFVINFSTKLRSKGIDAWLDKWEMRPGDSLIDRIFEEGIKNADAFIIVLSKNSVNKPWVREELNVAYVKKINAQAKIIPVVIDECEVPECLKSTLWEKISRLDSYEENLNRIVQVIFGISEKPILGNPPKHIATAIDILPGLNKIDTILFNYSCEISLQKERKKINTSEVYGYLKECEISDEEILESLEILDSKKIIKGQKTLGGNIPFFSITHHGFEIYIQSNFTDFTTIFNKACMNILNEGLNTNFQIAENMNAHILIVNHIFEKLEEKGLIKFIKDMSGRYCIHYINPELKRIFK
ncbi:TIR domain protein [Leptospira kirschneri str. 2008720114]|uniref:toll/interleukin-1 receptor domain-containing protein n=1 Tax=Leptospira kirschneri TaxID=29507 RepID=UPI0002978B38|nr:TIR domain-containing protein [Leptospira kirschneri]EKP05819.1 TIR domain protein [Leptospira kirschneri str. 2008720114]